MKDYKTMIHEELESQYDYWYEIWINFQHDVNPEEFFNEIIRQTQIFYEQQISNLLDDYYADEEDCDE